MISAIKDYGKTQGYTTKLDDEYGDSYDDRSSAWQFREIANIFRPICYYRGRCQFESEMDRKCTIRERVNANAQVGRESVEWDKTYDPENAYQDGPPRSGQVGGAVFIGAIHPAEWLLDPTAAR